MSAKTYVKKLLPQKLFLIIEPYGHLVESVFYNTLNGRPGKDIKVIGVTGTNGKTTTTFLIHEILKTAGYKSGILSTIGWGINEDIKIQKEHFTNVPTSQFMKRLKFMKKNKVDWLVMETTSHALAQNRVWGVNFSVAVLTNLTHEHLDYHRSFKNYRNAKRKLFKLTNANSNGLQAGVINADDDNVDYFVKDIKNSLTYGINNGDFRAVKIKSDAKGSTFEVNFNHEEYKIKCNIAGTFNVYNSLAAAAAAKLIGIDKKAIEQGIANLKAVEGRLTSINVGQNFDVIVDFAHTPDSFEKLFNDFKPLVKGRLIVMFGSPGRRDEAKRAIQGEIAGKYADILVLTEEDDRDVDGQKILNQITEGALKHGKKLNEDIFKVPKRDDAIAFALKKAKAGDMVMMLGKGHEKTIERADGTHDWNDIEITTNTLKRLIKAEKK